MEGLLLHQSLTCQYYTPVSSFTLFPLKAQNKHYVAKCPKQQIIGLHFVGNTVSLGLPMANLLGFCEKNGRVEKARTLFVFSMRPFGTFAHRNR
jgi:hypothetical protein